MKKRLVLLTLLILFIISTFLIAGCSFACEHDFDQGRVIKPATFTESGELVYTCSRCGDKKTEIIPVMDCVVTFNLDGGVLQSANSVNVKYGNIVSAPSQDPVKEGYEFIGWYYSNIAFDFETQAIYDNIELKAKWKANTYNITYLLHDDVVNTNPTTYTPDEEIELKDPERENYIFKGWNKNGSSEDCRVIEKGTIGDITLTAVWEIRKYIVTYVLDGGEMVIPNQTEFTFKSEKFLLNDASKFGYKFNGWYCKGQRIYAIEDLNEDVEVVAQYTPLKYKINYVLDEGVEHTNLKEYTIEDEIILSNPERDGYVFMGWNKNGSSTVITKIKKGTTGNLTLTANWKIITHIVEYKLDGGTLTVSNPTEWNVNTQVALLNNPSKLGYKFIGWYLDGEQIVQLENVSKDITIEARYEIIEYVITYILADGVTHSNPTYYTVEDEIVLKDARLDGHQFVCWNKDGASDEFLKIVKGSTGDMILTATFIKG